MAINNILKTRVSTTQTEMTGGVVDVVDIKTALCCVASVPVHGKVVPYHYVVFGVDSLDKAKDILYPPKMEHLLRQEFDDIYTGVGAFIFIFCKKIKSKVPQYEMEWSTACGAYAIQLSLFEAGYGVKWNTINQDAPMVDSLLKCCDLSAEYSTMGYLMIGTALENTKQRANIDTFSSWK